MIRTMITAFVSFASTNIDDIFVLMLFFSEINNGMKKQHIVIGQYLGIGLLTIISIIGALGISIIPSEYVGLLGLVPIYLGIKAYVDHKREGNNNEDIVQQNLQNGENKKIVEATDVQEKPTLKFLKNFINPSVIKVFSFTLANGADNIGIYIPLFTSMNLVDIVITVLMFMLLIALWCFFSIKLSEHPFVQKNIEKYKNIFVPIIFIGLGIFILIENETIGFIYTRVF
ncbi:cadmium resistance transporter [Clostridium sp. MB05]